MGQTSELQNLLPLIILLIKKNCLSQSRNERADRKALLTYVDRIISAYKISHDGITSAHFHHISVCSIFIF